jgi:tRNA (guanine37-N1)-methyltransferase
MKIDIITLFPKMFIGPFDESIINRAKDRGIVEINIHYLREWAEGRHQVVDDRPYGGGVGMLLMVEPLYKAITDLKKGSLETKVILLDAGGKTFTQGLAQGLSKEKHLIFICGRYEGVDHRVRENLIDMELSIGDYVLTGGELPTMVILDSVVRLIPGVLEKEDATALESHSEEGIVEYPQYTRPEDFNGWKVTEVLLSGDHKKIESWKKEQALARSQNRR